MNGILFILKKIYAFLKIFYKVLKEVLKISFVALAIYFLLKILFPDIFGSIRFFIFY